MTIRRHGLSIGIERVNKNFYLTLKAIGRLTHQDYEAVTPMIDSALQGVRDPQVKVLIDGTEMEGWELRAAWDDFKLVLKHDGEFRKIAIYGNKDWQEIRTKIGAWFVSGEVKYFENHADALTWLDS